MLGPCTPWETRRSTWLLPSDQRGAPAVACRPWRPLEGEPTAKEDLSLCLSLSVSLSLSLTICLSKINLKKKKLEEIMCDVWWAFGSTVRVFGMGCSRFMQWTWVRFLTLL